MILLSVVSPLRFAHTSIAFTRLPPLLLFLILLSGVSHASSAFSSTPLNREYPAKTRANSWRNPPEEKSVPARSRAEQISTVLISFHGSFDRYKCPRQSRSALRSCPRPVAIRTICPSLLAGRATPAAFPPATRRPRRARRRRRPPRRRQ